MFFFSFKKEVQVTVLQQSTRFSHPSCLSLTRPSGPADMTSCLCPSVLLGWEVVAV